MNKVLEDDRIQTFANLVGTPYAIQFTSGQAKIIQLHFSEFLQHYHSTIKRQKSSDRLLLTVKRPSTVSAFSDKSSAKKVILPNGLSVERKKSQKPAARNLFKQYVSPYSKRGMSNKSDVATKSAKSRVESQQNFNRDTFGPPSPDIQKLIKLPPIKAELRLPDKIYESDDTLPLTVKEVPQKIDSEKQVDCSLVRVTVADIEPPPHMGQSLIKNGSDIVVTQSLVESEHKVGGERKSFTPKATEALMDRFGICKSKNDCSPPTAFEQYVLQKQLRDSAQKLESMKPLQISISDIKDSIVDSKLNDESVQIVIKDLDANSRGSQL